MPIFIVRLLLVLLGASLWAGPVRADQGMLKIISEHGGAKMFIDGEHKGDTPIQPDKALALNLEEGEYRLDGVIEGGRTPEAGKSVYVAGGAIPPVQTVLLGETPMVALPAGCFRMGSPAGEPERDEDEGPSHRVCVEAFELGKYEVTFDEWDACVAAGGCSHQPGDEGWGRGRRPVINISWDDIQHYLAWLNQATAGNYRLPSEAEWEYAARAGTTTAFSIGNCITTREANYNGGSGYAGCGTKTGVYLQRTQPVGSYPANPWGLHDLHGNVYEWVEDCWNDSYQGAPSDGRAWRRGDCVRRVLRGGSWNNLPWFLRSAFRSRFGISGFRSSVFGFRLARTLAP